MRVEQSVLFESGNELAAYAAKQINYHVMGYYPITPITINLDRKAGQPVRLSLHLVPKLQ